MNKKLLLGAAITLASLQVSAVPFAPTDARAMAMGGTGVAAAKTVHAVQFNPSLLSMGSDDDDFGLLLPQMGGYLSDEDEFIDSADAFADADYATSFSDAITDIEAPLNNITTALDDITTASDAEDLAAINTATQTLNTHVTSLQLGTLALTNATTNLNSGLASISEKALRGGLGGGLGIAIPSKKFSVAISANNNISFSGKLTVAQADMNLLTDYTSATNAYASVLANYSSATAAVTSVLTDIDTETNGANDTATLLGLASDLDTAQTDLDTANTALTEFDYTGTAGNAIFVDGTLAPGADNIELASTVSIIAVAISEVAISISREFKIMERDVAIGITPKLQRIDAYNYIVSASDETDTGDIADFGIEDTGFNLDLGASTKFGALEQGTVGIVIKNLISKDIQTTDNNPLTNDLSISISPQIRAGVAYQAFGFVNLAADLDLIENDPIAFESATQFLALGAEADVLGFLQLRTGFRSNLAASGQDVISGGMGVSPFGLFHVDLGFYANTSAPEKEAGLVFELGLDW